MKTYVVDIDGTICTNTDGAYQNAEPYMDRIAQVNELYDEGNTVVYYTARGMGRGIAATLVIMTNEQLDAWGAKRHRVVFGKPAGDLYIDDKGTRPNLFFGDLDA